MVALIGKEIGLRPALRGWKLRSLRLSLTRKHRSPTRLEGMETATRQGRARRHRRSPTRLEGMETFKRR